MKPLMWIIENAEDHWSAWTLMLLLAVPMFFVALLLRVANAVARKI